MLIVLGGGAAATGAAAAYYWQRATAVPSWYISSAADGDLTTHLGSSSDRLQDQLTAQDTVKYLNDHQLEITLTEAEFNQLLQEDLAQSPIAASLLQATEGIKATFEENQLQAGAVVNPADLPLQDLPPEAQSILQQALNSLPMLENQAFYIGITGLPEVENGQLVLGEETQFQVGNLQLSLTEAARLTGLTSAQLTEQINAAIAQTGVTLEDLQIVNGQIVLRGKKE